MYMLKIIIFLLSHVVGKIINPFIHLSLYKIKLKAIICTKHNLYKYVMNIIHMYGYT